MPGGVRPLFPLPWDSGNIDPKTAVVLHEREQVGYAASTADRPSKGPPRAFTTSTRREGFHRCSWTGGTLIGNVPRSGSRSPPRRHRRRSVEYQAALDAGAG